jgi:hypothetical protein
MTINKYQGQSLKHAGSISELLPYVAVSSATSHIFLHCTFITVPTLPTLKHAPVVTTGPKPSLDILSDVERGKDVKGNFRYHIRVKS